MSITVPDRTAEREYLADVLSYLRGYHEEVSKQKSEIDAQVAYSLKHYNSDNAEQFTELTYNLYHQDAFYRKESETRYALNKPYFARVDFTPDDTPGVTRNYIGKMTLMRGLEILITDWRAPVASLYYEGRLGRAAYECPEGEIAGEITLKRQYNIENGELRELSDIDITTNDTFLQAALGASKDRRLRDIVTTIQAEQNRVIRAPLFTPLIVQGVAGGGKTTIALHRIAYLLYAYEKQLAPRQVMIMAPNRLFLSYISEVLPDLGVDNVHQTTFEDFAAACIELDKKKWTVNSAMDVVAEEAEQRGASHEAMASARLKSGLRFYKLIKRYCKYLEKNAFPKKDFVLEGYELFTHEALADLFLREYSYLPLAKRAAEIHKNLTNTLRKEKPLILQSIDADYDRRRETVKRHKEDGQERRQEIINLLDERDEKLKRIKNKSHSIVREYMKNYDMPPLMTHYENLFNDLRLLAALAKDLFTAEEIKLIASFTSLTLARRQLNIEDLPPLMLMRQKLYGLEDTNVTDVKHIVVDEAQDFSLFQFAVLKLLSRNASFSILGDIHQGIYAYKGIRDWDELRRLVFSASSASLTLEQSYRTTVEIMEAANPVISRLYPNGSTPAVPLAKPVIRHGGSVTVITGFDGLRAAAAAIDGKIKSHQQQDGFHSIAVIGKNLGECKALLKLMKTKIPLITGQEDQYEGGLLLLPSYLAKGLEFDAVLIANASEDNYQLNELDIKLLYITMTRALHELTIFCAGKASPLLEHLSFA